jgi:CRISPR-associated protein Cmr2
MRFKKPDRQYWDDKFAAYLHDPFDKVFRIQGHPDRSKEILKRFGLDMPNDEFWKKADGIASGFERGQVPSHSKDQNQNGAVDFVDSNGKALISHPIGSNGGLPIHIGPKNIDDVHDALVNFLEDEIGKKPEGKNYSNHYRDNHEDFCVARFFYSHLVLRFQLAEQNVAGLGGLWHRLPADTRFPDHSIWQHNALTSALYSSMRLAGCADNIGLMVFSLTPVQGFIGNARKLRDYWTGSLLLSWLAFEGLRWVMENLGPDHVLYPSLIDQPLVLEYLANNWQMQDLIKSTKTLSQVRNIGSLPNKLVLLLPLNHVEDIATGIETAIRTAWHDLGEKMLNWLFYESPDLTPDQVNTIRHLFTEQMDSFWELQWSAARLLAEKDKNAFEQLLPDPVINKPLGLLKLLNGIIADKIHYEKEGRGTLYTLSHHLAQSGLAAQKLRRRNQRAPQNGRKCSLCGEFEALHHMPHTDGQDSKEYNQNMSDLWVVISKRIGSRADREIRANERLCAICLNKRLAYRVLRNSDDHVLKPSFADEDNFPSTTEIALNDWFIRNGEKDKERRTKIADEIHEKDESRMIGIVNSYGIKKKPGNRDNYYAILVMDGDRMGKLVNGATLAANWETVMHPDMHKRLKDDKFSAKYREPWQKIFSQYNQRNVTPAIHAAISEALGDFALNGVAPIVKKYDGRLIYAGGDDVVAVFPLSGVLAAAGEINQFYQSGFQQINSDGKTHEIDGEYKPAAGKLAVLMGKGESISLSAAILICHHKDNLSHLLQEAQSLLKTEAKEKTGRNALALRLKKRSGGDRTFTSKWDYPAWTAFANLQKALVKGEGQDLSRSLIYRLHSHKDGLRAICEHPEKKKLLPSFIETLLGKSGIKSKQAGEIANNMALLLEKDDKTGIEALQIAAFLAGNEEDQV